MGGVQKSRCIGLARASEAAARTSKASGRASEASGKALDAAGRASDAAGRPSEMRGKRKPRKSLPKNATIFRKAFHSRQISVIVTTVPKRKVQIAKGKVSQSLVVGIYNLSLHKRTNMTSNTLKKVEPEEWNIQVPCLT